MTEPSKNIEDINVDLFDLDQFVADYDTHKGWNDIGEMAVLLSLASAVRGKPILDVGMGTGRTTPLLALLTDDYVGIDYAPNMVREAKAVLPGFDLRVGDVRNLREDFGDESKALVFFSFNGLDCLDHATRPEALEQMAHVVAPGGYLVYSTLNLESPHPGKRPWTPPEPPPQRGIERPVRWTYRWLQWALQMPSNLKNWRHAQSSRKAGDGWANEPSPGSHWQLILHFTTLARAKAEVAATGLVLERVITLDGVDVTNADSTDALYFYLVARRPATA
ncbi:hypothetical protein MANY_35710 [Mycolicibacterium anyangense]|uniref:Methyltransferase domain-containing protein n=1 Tax=Mycolicibacterium anyangense TaxID=1431246 RepID=A0A6N4WDP2_9MYCO|nr:class I SAM-dependent methyltransferase [Mycolicibacterium anyangense]BBZ78234.1 hypothetical protein MANY_35710 [Mycolicibacterium anyangense]